ncbi:hypothetical protein CWE15_00965 [Aliidiomarina taiwanensis]|uniref:TonB-dependent receptor n=1 Tax=Aliidiomarina taiwanensis TaxID=946228 RepID=A0A432X8S2_9GAMM|nr:TonB-dependent receptor [Aliidiomarina taiwanensis]RUO43803.1 hypothetical protein CWE15_00965 [Aliidiomarina taiwanensis]
MLQKTRVALAVAAVIFPLSIHAHEAENEEPHEHDHKYERIIVTASPLEKSAINSSQPIHVLSDDELRAAQAATLGETLRGIPGVQSSYFGPTSSSPVIRGLDGPRVKIVQNGLDAADISRGGPDHAVSTESTTAQQIEVFRGPSTLLFGSGASGGVVNVVDNRVPRYSVQGVSGYYGAGYSSGANERNVSAGVDAGTGDIALHLDAFVRKGDDYDIPRFLNDEGELSTKIDNSFTDDVGFNLGASYFVDSGFIGFSYGRMERDYGLPGHSHGDDEHAGHDEHEAHDDIYASFVQDRFQVLGSFMDPITGFKRLDINLGYTEMTHDEIEGEHVETSFGLEQTELRLTAAHNPLFAWDGAVGVQVQNQKYVADGLEAFTPSSETDLAGLFWLVERTFDKLTYEGGVRIEEVRIKTDSFDTIRYTPFSGSFGMNYKATPDLNYTLNLSYSERAPQAYELFSNGAHFATRTYELGGVYALHLDPDAATETYHLEATQAGLSKEQAKNIDLGVHYDGAKFHLDASVFYNRIGHFIYQENIGINSDMLEHDHSEPADHAGHDHGDTTLPIYAYRQQDAELIGYEVSGHYEFNSDWHVGAFSDYTRAKFTAATADGKNIPRIPAQRAGMHINYMNASWDVKATYTYHFKQDKVALNEEETAGFGTLDLHVNYYPSLSGNQDVALYFKAENLTNQLGFAHNSFIKAHAPLPGRSFGIGVRTQF